MKGQGITNAVKRMWEGGCCGSRAASHPEIKESRNERSTTKNAVRDRFADTVKHSSGYGCSRSSTGISTPEFIRTASRTAGYTEQDLQKVPDGANLGLGCGNPVALAAMQAGDTVLDLGSGAGIDCFLAAAAVGPTGRVIGVDMTPEMVEKANANAAKSGHRNVEFRLGEIEDLPLASSFVDVIISNCVINLSPDKPRVFQEAFRVLRPGGRLMVSDMVLLEDLPEAVRSSVDAYVRCIGGASRKEDYLTAVRDAGFRDIQVVGESSFPAELIAQQPVMKELIDSLGMPMAEVERIAATVVSVKVAARKPVNQ